MNRKLLFSIIILPFLNIQARAEESVVPVLTVEQAVATALNNSPAINIAQQKLKDAKGQEISAFSNFTPTLALTGSYLNLNEAVTSMGMVVSPKESYSYGFTVQQNLFMSGKLISAYGISLANMRALQEEYRKTINDVIFETKKAFYNLLLAQKMAELMQESYSQMQQHVQQVKVYYENGIVSKFDLLRAQVQLSNLKPQLKRVSNGVELAGEALNLTIGSPIGTNYILKGEIAFQELEDVNAEKMAKEALNNKPDLKMMAERTAMANKALTLAVEANGPNVVGIYTWKKAKPYSAFVPPTTLTWLDDWDTPDWNAVLSVQWPLSFGNYGKLKSAKAQAQQAKMGYQVMKDAAVLEVKQVCLALEQEKQNIETQKENIGQAQEALSIAEERYKQGIISNLEYMDTQLALTQAKTNYFQAITNYEIAKAQLMKAIGKK
ncbi:MAG: hypothetical protein A2252_02840 [Elusimicrobia bacterium RIFOXYA2_FULL_39_19]|nr:MAG: hypothetical protein A2252_02840 [Elusimicrobia bacterium RIFOXYA2_FULL_39_19]